jgi:A/G-specific adenine glycosylase
MPLPALSRFQAQLLEWFAAQQRKLPWRQDYAPYGVWISEMMLQQTRVTTVLSYYERWMRELPDIASVAAAEEAQLLKLWEGLGYYSRVRNIQKAARQICAEHGGAFPTDFAAIRRLPGIGPYTAGAIASIAFEQDRPIVDGNVVRVACRVFHITDNPKESDVQKRLWNIAAAWIPAGQARHFNQAVMELGATVCHVQQPTCLLCPVQEHCQHAEPQLPSPKPSCCWNKTTPF